MQVVLSDLLSLVSNRFVAGCFNKSLWLCCQQLATDLFPQACYRLTKPTHLSRLVDNLPQAGKINSVRQACEISGCVRVTTQSILMIARNMCIIWRDRIIALARENQEMTVKLSRSCSLVSSSMLKLV
jgi:hypothetical protein